MSALIDDSALTAPGVRVFQEWGPTNSARWYILPDGSVLHSRDRGHLAPSQHGAGYIEVTLEEIPSGL